MEPIKCNRRSVCGVHMHLSPAEIVQLKKIVSIAQSLLSKAEGQGKPSARRARGGNGAAQVRRTGKELAAFRKMLKAERKAGAPVAELAKKHGVSVSYIYQLG
jgi:hypothetical protein